MSIPVGYDMSGIRLAYSRAKVVILTKILRRKAMEKQTNAKTRMSIVLMFVFLLSSASVFSGGKGPVIKFESDQIDFGKVKQGEVLNHVFIFKNEGDETLLIKKVRTSCGCTAVLLKNKEVPPGQTGEIKVTFNTKGYGDRVSKYIYIDSNDKSHPSRKIIVSALIEVPPQPRIALERYSQDLGLFLENEEIKALAKIKNIGELELKVSCSHKDAEFYSGGKEVSFPLKIRAGKDTEVEIRIPPRKRRGMLREYILMKSNDPRRPTLSFYLSGYVVSKDQLKDLFARYKDILD